MMLDLIIFDNYFWTIEDKSLYELIKGITFPWFYFLVNSRISQSYIIILL